MHVVIPHSLGRAEARSRIERFLLGLRSRFEARIEDLDDYWEGDTYRVTARVSGMRAEGSVEVGDHEVIVDGTFPPLVRPFESMVRARIEREGKQLLERRY